jgi:uncharacterized protein YjaZ
MSIDLHIMTAGDPFPLEVERRLWAALDAGRMRVAPLLNLDEVDVIAVAMPWSVIPRLGLNGEACTANLVMIKLDPKREDLLADIDNRVGAILAHELHHCARMRGPGYGQKLGERLVSEGLAQCFEEEAGFDTPFYAVECAGRALKAFGGKALEQIERADLNFNDWMSGSRISDQFPYQCGYSLGYTLVRQWLELTGQTAAAAARVEAGEVLSLWQRGAIQVRI